MKVLLRNKIKNFKKISGFTLTELLAVIVILGLIAILVSQNFIEQVQVSKQQIYEKQIKTIINSAKDYHLRNLNKDGVTLQTLENEGLINTSEMEDPRDNTILTGCVLFETNSYGQIDYIYKDDLSACSGIS